MANSPPTEKRTRRRTNIRKRGKAWVVYFRQDGKQVWRSFTSKDAAELYLAQVQLTRAKGERVAVPARKVLFAELASEWLSTSEHDRACTASTMKDYRSVVRSQLLPAFGRLRLEQITAGRIEAWRSEQIEARHPSNRTLNKQTAVLHGIFELARRRYGYGSNPIDDVEKLTEAKPGPLDFYSPEEVWALVRAAKSEQDAALFLTAAFSGLRQGELIALRWRGLDFTGHAIRVSGSYSAGALGLPKWGKVRSVPMVDDLAEALAKLGQRGECVGDDDLVFPGERGGFLDDSALRRRYVAALKRAGLRRLRFHDLRHVFGSLAIKRADIVQVQSWMGHADIKTTMRYLHSRPMDTDAALLGQAFKVEKPTETASELQAVGVQTDAGRFRSDATASGDFPAKEALLRNAAA